MSVSVLKSLLATIATCTLLASCRGQESKSDQRTTNADNSDIKLSDGAVTGQVVRILSESFGPSGPSGEVTYVVKTDDKHPKNVKLALSEDDLNSFIDMDPSTKVTLKGTLGKLDDGSTDVSR